MEDRGGAVGFDGPKHCLITVGRYVLVGVGRAEENMGSDIGGATSSSGSSGSGGVIGYDLRHKYVVLHQPLDLGEVASRVITDRGASAAFVLSNSGKQRYV